MKYKVYVKLNARSDIVEINSDYYLAETGGYIKIDEGGTERHKEAATQYLEKGLMGFNGRVQTPNYKYVSDELIERTDEEKALDPYSDEPKPEPDYAAFLRGLMGVE